MTPASPAFLVDHHVGPAILDGIRDAKREVLLVSPYVKLWGRLDQELERARQRGVRLRLFYRTDSAGKLDLPRLNALFHEITAVDLLHAKLYGFDGQFIVSSMNLYNFSEENSREVALRIVDQGQCDEIHRYITDHLTPFKKPAPPPVADFDPQMDPAKLMKKFAEFLGVHPEQAPATNAPTRQSSAPPVKQSRAPRRAEGFCIRCGDGLALNPEKPLCGPCYKEWAKFKNPQYEERQCHLCGKPNRTSVLKPLCFGCYKKVTA